MSLGDDPFSFPELHYTPRKKDSMEINEVEKRAIIIAEAVCVMVAGFCTILNNVFKSKKCDYFCWFSGKRNIGMR